MKTRAVQIKNFQNSTQKSDDLMPSGKFPDQRNCKTEEVAEAPFLPQTPKGFSFYNPGHDCCCSAGNDPQELSSTDFLFSAVQVMHGWSGDNSSIKETKVSVHGVP